MTLTMFYIKGMHKKNEFHSNIPAEDMPAAFSIFKDHNPSVVITQITALFTFDVQEEPEPSVLVTQ